MGIAITFDDTELKAFAAEVASWPQKMLAAGQAALQSESADARINGDELSGTLNIPTARSQNVIESEAPSASGGVGFSDISFEKTTQPIAGAPLPSMTIPAGATVALRNKKNRKRTREQFDTQATELLTRSGRQIALNKQLRKAEVEPMFWTQPKADADVERIQEKVAEAMLAAIGGMN